MMTSSASINAASCSAVEPANAAGTMIHAARGAVSLATKSSSEDAPTAPSPARPSTASGLTS